MIRLDLVCSTCRHSFQLEAATTLKDEEKRCPKCGSESTRQTFASYLRNGPLLDPKWGCAGEGRGFG
jgi:DNA-directed RNA polymerase subunit RPC12/RpoP